MIKDYKDVSYNILFVGVDVKFKKELKKQIKELKWPVNMFFASSTERARDHYAKGKDIRFLFVFMENPKVDERLANNLGEHFEKRPVIRMTTDLDFIKANFTRWGKTWGKTCKYDFPEVLKEINYLTGKYE